MSGRNERSWRQRLHGWNRGLRERKSSLRLNQEYIDRFKSCKYCNKSLTPINAGLDHQQPISRGGKDDLFNLILVCQPCNRAKSSFSDAEFSALLAFLDKPPWTPEMKKRLIAKMKAAWRCQ